MPYFAYTTPFPPPRPKTPFTYVVYLYSDIKLYKGHIGSSGGGGGGGGGREASKIKLKDANFIFSMTNVTILSIFRMHGQNEYRKVQKIKGTYIHNVLALLLFGNLQRIY